MENKAKNSKSIFTDQEKESNREFSVNSEEIASFILEKLISLAITEEQRRRTHDQILNKCFSYLTNMFKNYLKLEFLPHDIDDYLTEKNSESLYSNEIQQHNKLKNNWMPKSNLNNKANGHNLNRINEQNKDEDELNDSDSSQSTIKKQNSKQFQSVPSIDSVKLENSFNTQIENNNENLLLLSENPRNIFFDNYIFGVNDWTITEEPVIFI